VTPPMTMTGRRHSGGPVRLLADVDCLQAYPMHTHNLTRASMDMSAAQFRGTSRKPNDLTVHGVRVRGPGVGGLRCGNGSLFVPAGSLMLLLR